RRESRRQRRLRRAAAHASPGGGAVSAASRLRALGLGPGKELRALSASGQLGYGIPEKAFEEGLSRDPHFLGCDMGSIDAGPYYLGAGKIQTSDAITRRDMRLVLNAAVKRNIP